MTTSKYSAENVVEWGVVKCDEEGNKPSEEEIRKWVERNYDTKAYEVVPVGATTAYEDLFPRIREEIMATSGEGFIVDKSGPDFRVLVSTCEGGVRRIVMAGYLLLFVNKDTQQSVKDVFGFVTPPTSNLMN